MKFSFVIISLLGFVAAFAQPNREELALRDEKQFDLAFIFQYQDNEAFTVSFSRENNIDEILIINTDCQTNGIQYKRPIADRYVYEQMLDYLQDINITNFQPTQNGQDAAAKLQVQGSIHIQRTWTVNAFVFRHNPDNIGDESQILDYVVDVLKDNASDDCSKKLAELLEKYIKGTE